MIDCHQHFWRYDAGEYAWIDDSMSALKRDFLPPDALDEMERTGVTASIAVQARQSLDETRWLLDLADRHPFIRGVVGWIDLQAGDVEGQLTEFSGRPALVGIRHIVQAEPDGFLALPAFRAGVAQLEPTGLVYDILVYARQLPDAVAFARALPRQRFVLDHLGKPDVRSDGFRQWRRHFDELASLPNVFCKLSGLVTEADWRSWTPGQLRPYIDAALESFGPSRLMIGTDWPVCTVAASYWTVVALVAEAIDEYSEAERQQILEGTARKVYEARL
ncbi:MAG TPA: amidohydrolase family protein [Vicinamibacterales bacterium]